MNRYQDLKKDQEKRYNDFVKEGMFFAFSNQQFKEGMEKFGLDENNDLDKIYSIGYGGFVLKDKSKRLHELTEKFADEIQAKVNEDQDGLGFVYDMFKYELENHEYSYTNDVTDALDALGYTIEEISKDEKLKTGLIKAVKDIEEFLIKAEAQNV